jgi:predicted Zn finger-like uncharacterized protein
MPFSFQCPNCQAKLTCPKLPENSRLLKCPHCQQTFSLAPPAQKITMGEIVERPAKTQPRPMATAAAEEESWDEPKPRRRRRRRDDDEREQDFRPSRVRLIEKTSKGWKGLMLAGALMAIVGIIGTCAGVMSATNKANAAGAAYGPSMATGLFILLLFGGLVLFIFARVGAWWNHG